MTTIYFIRHGQPDLSIEDNLIRPLTSQGEKDINEVFLLLKNIPFDVFYASNYYRSQQSIKPLSIYHNKDIIIEEDLKERIYGNRDIEINQYFKKQWSDFNFKCQGGESLNDVKSRHINIINKILIKHPNQTICIGYHGTALSVIINYYDKNKSYDNFLYIKDKMPYVIKMEFEETKFIKMEEIYYKDRGYSNIEKLK